jgi:cytochrome o ubiquinol oxidase operon protein cyoD
MKDVKAQSNHDDVSVKNYVIGFILSIVFTIIPFWTVAQSNFSTSIIVIIVAISALIQLLVQLIFFMHLGAESKPRLNLASFIFSFLMILIIVIGSFWIMYSLDHIANPNHQMDNNKNNSVDHSKHSNDHSGH